MSKYDVGIIGVWYGCNYGSIATYYALNQVISSMGKSVLMIDKPIIHKDDIERKANHSRCFAENRYNISEQYHLDEMNKLNELCSGFLLGSDQLWNYGISRNFGKTFYLDFAEEQKKKIACGVSFGHGIDFAPPEERKEISKLMKKFDAIGVRESDAVGLCEDVYEVRARQVLDPVFLAEPSIYEPLIASSRYQEDDPFLLTYILDPTPEKREAILYISKKLGNIKIINILDGWTHLFEKNKNSMNLDNCLKDVHVEEWLYYIKNAKFVITDSCHGASFALIFKKQFVAITNKARGFSRFKSLSQLFKFEKRLVTDPKRILSDDSLLEPMDYAEIDKIMKSQRKECYEWLKNALDEPKRETSVLIKRNTINKPITKLLEKKMCAGCAACVNSCPKSALKLQVDEHGYYRAQLDEELCINCGICKQVCPALNLPEKNNNQTPECIAFIAKEEEVLQSSSSGGVFTLLAREAFKKNGHVAGAAWKDDFSVEHILIDKEADLPKLQKSKYLQTYIGDSFRKVKEKLQNNEFVLFSGCPCQIAGLKKYLGKEYDNLLLVDLLCGNSPSSMFFKKYLEEDFPQGVINYRFRNKQQGWNCENILVELKDGNSIVRSGVSQDAYQRVFHNHTMCAPHCENCKYQSLPRFGDLTIGDFWGYSKRDKDVDTKKGISVVLINNEKGKKYFDLIPQESINVKKAVPLEWLGGNGYALKGRNYASPYRDRFYEAIQKVSFSQAVEYAFSTQGVSNYPNAIKCAPLQYNTAQMRFIADSNMWEEHFINGVTVLTTKQENPPLGYYASIPLMHTLIAGKKYKLVIRFKIKTDSKELNLHIKEALTKKIQIIHTHKVSAEDAYKWVEIETEFIPNSNVYSEFMVGAGHVKGKERFIAIDYIDIREK